MIQSNYDAQNKTLFKVNIDGKWGIYDTGLNEIIPCQYDDILVHLYRFWHRPLEFPIEDSLWYYMIDFVLLDNNKYSLAHYNSSKKLIFDHKEYDELYVYYPHSDYYSCLGRKKIILVKHNKDWILLLNYSSYGYSPYDEIKIEDNKILLRRKQSIGTLPFDEVGKDIRRNIQKVERINNEYCKTNQIELSSSIVYRKYLRSIERERTFKATFDEQLLGFKIFLEMRLYDE